MKILAIITARKNSKRIKNKNKILFKNKKLIEHTFLLAKKSKLFFDVLLTTDDKELVRLSKKYNILAPWVRPKEISSDFSPSYKAVIHAYNWYENNHGKVDGIFVLQPTSPFRTVKTLKEMIKIFKSVKKKTVVSVSKCTEHPEWMLKLKNNKIIPYFSEKYFNRRSQSLAKFYKINGLGYLINPLTLIKEKTLIPKNSVPCINKSKIESIDIDDMQDYLIAKKV